MRSKFYKSQGAAHRENEQSAGRKFGLQRMNSVNMKLMEGDVSSVSYSDVLTSEHFLERLATFLTSLHP